METIPFNIKYRELIEAGEYKVVTRDGRPARIICWDRQSTQPIVALAYTPVKEMECFINASDTGVCSSHGFDDLFILVPTLKRKESNAEKIINQIIDYLTFAKNKNLLRASDYKVISDWVDFLQNQREYLEDVRQYAYNKGIVDAEEKQKEQKHTEWREKDMKVIYEIIRDVNAYDAYTGTTFRQPERHDEKINFLRTLSPQSHWKPSEEQMEALMLAIEGKWDAIKPTGYMSRRLEDLYDGIANTFGVECKLEE